MESKQLEEKVQRVTANEATKHVWRKDYASVAFQEANELNELLFHESLERKPKCACLETFYFNLKFRHLNLHKLINMEEKQFKVKPTVVLQNFCLSEPLTQHSSDADCIKLLRAFPKCLKHFESVPSNWEEIVNAETEVETTEEELDAMFEELETLSEVPNFSEMLEPALRAYAKEKDVSLKGKTGRVQIAELLTVHYNNL